VRFRAAFLPKFYLVVPENALSSNFAQKLAADIPSFVKYRPKISYPIMLNVIMLNAIMLNISLRLRPNYTAT
jgi:hypothetical protein